MTIHANSFVKRQTSESEFSHYEAHEGCEDTWECLRDLVSEAYEAGAFEQGYREGVVLVSVEPHGFFSGVVTLSEGASLAGSFRARREGETPRKSVQAADSSLKKMPAKSVKVVLYASTVLAEDGDNELPPEKGNWEIISVNANPCDEEMPINPNVLMHNHFGSDGGTDTHLSDEEFVKTLRESFLFWKDKAMIAPKKD